MIILKSSKVVLLIVTWNKLSQKLNEIKWQKNSAKENSNQTKIMQWNRIKLKNE